MCSSPRMSTSPEHTRADDLIVNSISQWLARHIGDAELRMEIERVGTGELAPEQAEAVEELLVELVQGTQRGELEMIAREAVEMIALGG